MIAAYAVSMIVFSVSLAVLALLVFLGARRFFGQDPIAAHRFALIALVSVLVALPARFVIRGDPVEATPAEGQEGEADRDEVPGEARLIDEIQILRTRIAATQAAMAEVSRPALGLSEVEVEGETETARPAAAGAAGLNSPRASGPIEAEATLEKAKPATSNIMARLAGLLSGRFTGRRSELFIIGVALLHLLGILLVGRRRLARLLATRAMVARAEPTEREDLERLWLRIAGKRAGRTRLLVSDEIDSPACFGIRHPVLILPRSALERRDRGGLAWALRHELVHIRRGDCLVSPLQHLMVALAWFHPAAWWLERELIRLRELSCDRQVVAANGGRKSYALALIEFAQERGSRAGNAAPMDAPALIPWSGGKTFLQRRIEMLAHGNHNASTWARSLRLGTLTAACLGLWLVDLGFAAAIPRPQEPPAGGVVIIAEPVTDEPMQDEEILIEETEADESMEVEEILADEVALDLESIETDLATTTFFDPFSQDQDETPRLGITLKEVDETLAAQLGIDKDSAIVVDTVTENSAAAKAGLMKHDVIVQINRHPASLENLRAERDKSAGKTPLVLEIRRRARRMNIVVWGKDRARDSWLKSRGSDAPAAAGQPFDFGGADAAGQDGGGLPPRRGDDAPAAGGMGEGPRAPRARGENPAARGDLRGELDRLKQQLAELEQRLQNQPQADATGPQAPKRRADGTGENAPGPRVLATPARPDAGPRAQEVELRRREMAAKIESLANDRQVLATELRDMKTMREGISDEKERQMIDQRITRLEVKLDELERMLDEMNTNLKNSTERQRRGRRAERRLEGEGAGAGGSNARSAVETQMRVEELHALAAEAQEISAESKRRAEELARAEAQLQDMVVNKGWTDQTHEVPAMRARIAELTSELASLMDEKARILEALTQEKEAIRQLGASLTPEATGEIGTRAIQLGGGNLSK